MIKYKFLPTEIKIMLQFNEWLMYSIKREDDFDVDYYSDFEKIRFWSVDTICELGINYDDIPTVDNSNQNKVFKESRSKINLKAFKSASTHEFNIGLDENNMLVPVFDKQY